jgi:hypothetical protein
VCGEALSQLEKAIADLKADMADLRTQLGIPRAAATATTQEPKEATTC